MKRFLLSYDIIADKCTERELWDALYEMKGLTIVDKPVLSTLLVESENELMHKEICKMFDNKFRNKIYYAVSRIDERIDEDGDVVYCYCKKRNPESQKQIQEYLKEKQS